MPNPKRGSRPDCGSKRCGGSAQRRQFAPIPDREQARQPIAMTTPWSNDAFIAETANRNGWQWSQQEERSFAVYGAVRELTWRCSIEQSDFEGAPESLIEWVTPELVITDSDIRQVLDQLSDAVRSRSGTPVALPVPQLHIRYAEPQTEIGQLFALARRFRQGGFKSLFAASEPELLVEDTAGIVDDTILTRLRHWPDAFAPNGRRTPARLGYARVERGGFLVQSRNWWASAEALTHQIQLGLDLAIRLQPHFIRR